QKHHRSSKAEHLLRKKQHQFLNGSPGCTDVSSAKPKAEKLIVTILLLPKGIYSNQDILSVTEISPEELQAIRESIH
ncbi:MAG: hypothetical protein LUF34_08970, partial [Lachnospiraceae bacterium]|nr:hypothetical protein [Lachnospiraceae bacterium]